tara:strand:+ start:366 stop:623 length:258 start_codon:yes stop_codon:yes gene_type:complete
MKIFVVKTFIVALAFFIVFELTISSKIRMVENSVIKFAEKSERVKIKEKILLEISNANKKEKILSEKDRLILSEFIKKIQIELSQ